MSEKKSAKDKAAWKAKKKGYVFYYSRRGELALSDEKVDCSLQGWEVRELLH